MKSRFAIAAVSFLCLTVMPALAAAQTPAEHRAQAKQIREAKSAADQAPPQQKSDGELADVSNDAAGRKEAPGEGDQYAVLKHSPSVRYFARRLGIRVEAAYWLFVGFNFLLIGIALYIIFARTGLKILDLPPLPQWLVTRNELLRKNLDEAQRASADANRRLRDIEQKLARLGTDISGLEQHAATAAAAEQARLQSAAEEEKQRIVRAAEQEISAAANSARRDLRTYAAELAIGLAEKKIKVDTATDQALVRDFVDRLGKNKN